MTSRRHRLIGSVGLIALACIALGRDWAWLELTAASDARTGHWLAVLLELLVLSTGVAQLWWDLRAVTALESSGSPAATREPTGRSLQ